MNKIFNKVKNIPVLPELNVETREDGVRFYTSPDGMKYPSITTVLSHSKREIIQEWKNRIGEKEANAIVLRAGVRGNRYHTMIEKYIKNDPSFKKGIMPDMLERFHYIKPFLDKIDNIRYQEVSLYSDELGIAGRTDLIADYDGVESIIDFKSSLKEKREDWITNYFEQGAGYGEMHNELMFKKGNDTRINQTVIMISNDYSKEPQIFIKKNSDYIDGLKDKIATYYREVINSKI